jgi:formate dehydrogenase major subunit
MIPSRRGAAAIARARADDGTPRAVFIPFCYYEAAATRQPVLDPVGKIPEFKYWRCG